MSMTKEQKALDVAEEEVSAAARRLTDAKAELEKAVAKHRLSRSDQDWEAKKQVDSQIERYTAELQSITAERDEAAKTLARAKVAEYQQQLNAAAKEADLAIGWEPLLAEVAGIYEQLGALSARVVEVARHSRASAASYDALANEARAYASKHRVGGPNVPSIARQPAASLTLQCFRETLVNLTGLKPDARYVIVPPGEGQFEESHLRRIAEMHGTVAAEDPEAWTRRVIKENADEGAIVGAQREKEKMDLERARTEELKAREQEWRNGKFSLGFTEADLPPLANYSFSNEQLN